MFFATRNDLEPGLRKIEEQLPLKYVLKADYPTPEYTVYYSVLDIPGLGTTDSAYTCYSLSTTYLIFPQDAMVNVKATTYSDGQTDYTIERHENPHAFNFHPGGWYVGKKYAGEFMMGGCVIVSETTPDEMLDTYHLIWKTLTRKFKSMKSPEGERWRVGPEAYEALKRGVRLVTDRIDAPPSVDLQLPIESK